MILEIYTLLHVIISLIGIFSGLVVLFGLLSAKHLDGWTKWFLITTVLTSVTGFFFPFHGFTSHWRRHHFALSAGCRNLRALPAPTRGGIGAGFTSSRL
jgi:hypothetical protein